MPWRNEIVGWMSIQDLKCIEQIASEVPANGTIVEIGSMFGRSSVCWALSADPSVTVYCIDLFEEVRIVNHGALEEECLKFSFPLPDKMYNAKTEFIKNTQDLKNIVAIQGNSPGEITWTNTEIDILFIDAEHKNPGDWNNIQFFAPFIKEGGIICGHDYNDAFPDIMRNVQKLEELTGNVVDLRGSANIWTIKIDKKITIADIV
jgi:predicted O-methyltransferase YrrM